MTTMTAAATPTSVRYDSRSGGAGHEVTVRTRIDGTAMYLTCTCPGGRFAFAGDRKGRGCWAMVETRKALGMVQL